MCFCPKVVPRLGRRPHGATGPHPFPVSAYRACIPKATSWPKVAAGAPAITGSAEGGQGCVPWAQPFPVRSLPGNPSSNIHPAHANLAKPSHAASSSCPESRKSWLYSGDGRPAAISCVLARGRTCQCPAGASPKGATTRLSGMGWDMAPGIVARLQGMWPWNGRDFPPPPRGPACLSSAPSP